MVKVTRKVVNSGVGSKEFKRNVSCSRNRPPLSILTPPLKQIEQV
jgi:hypothetical protein